VEYFFSKDAGEPCFIILRRRKGKHSLRVHKHNLTQPNTRQHSPSTLRDSNQKLASDKKDERPKITLRAFKDELQLWHMAGAKGLSALGLGAVTSS
jgi:hypothetical protein